MISSRKLAAIGALALLVALPSVTAANNSWGNYHWARTSNPFTLKLGDNLTAQWQSIFETTKVDWNKSTVLQVAEVTGQGAFKKRCNPTAGRVEVCNNTYGYNGWLGVASIWASGSHITQGTVKVNDSYFNTSTYNTTAWRNLVMCQEVGHTFGLAHQDETFDNANLGTCMDYTNDPDGFAGGASSNDPSNEHPNAHDYAQLVTIYSHNDSSTTIGSSLPSASGAGVGSWNAEFGRLVATSSDGRTSTFVRDLGAGQRIITHVIWA